MINTVSEVKILVVDDQPEVVDELSEFLQSSGYCCVPCLSSSQAIECFAADPAIGLVLCDLHMPECDGVELFRALKVIAGPHRLFEAIMLTGGDDKQDLIRALREGFADYYQKPVNLNELLEGVQRQEAALQQRQQSFQHLGDLNQKLQFLADSIDDLYQDLEKAAAWVRIAVLPMLKSRLPTTAFRAFSRNSHLANLKWRAWSAKARPTTRSPASWA